MTQIATIEPTALSPLTPEDVIGQVTLIQTVMKSAMHDGQHYGKIPGCGDKPTLLKPGAEKLCLTFRFAADFEIDQTDLANGHREYRVKCILTNSGGGFVGAGIGCCSTMESKYRYRNTKAFTVTDDPIPRDAKENKAKYREKGYGMQKVDGEWKWVRYEAGGNKVENEDPADCYNTVLKMAKKRAHVDAVLTATAASDIFAQDLEELATHEPEAPKPRANVFSDAKAAIENLEAVNEQTLSGWTSKFATREKERAINSEQRKELVALLARKAVYLHENKGSITLEATEVLDAWLSARLEAESISKDLFDELIEQLAAVPAGSID